MNRGQIYLLQTSSFNIIQMTGDLCITRDCKLIGHHFGLGSGFKVQSSGLTALPFFP